MAFVRGESNFSTHGFIPIIFSPKVLAILEKKVAALDCVNRDWEGEIANYGDIVRIRYASPYPVSAFTEDQAITYGLLSENYLDLPIDQQIYAAYRLGKIDQTQSDLDAMGLYANQVAVSIRNSIDTGLTTKMVSGVSVQTTLGGTTIGSVLQLTASNIARVYTDVYQMLQESNASFLAAGDMPFTIVTPAVYALMKNSKLLNIGVPMNGYEGEPIDEFQGFSVKLSTNTTLNAQSGSNDDYVNIMCGYKFATTFALQINADEEVKQLQGYFAEGHRFLVVWGATVTHPTGLARVIAKV